MKYTHIKTDGTKEVLTFSKPPSMEQLQKLVGGSFQMITLPNRDMFWCNEEGYAKRLPYNIEATKIWRSAFPIEKYPYNNTYQIMGDVLLVERS